MGGSFKWTLRYTGTFNIFIFLYLMTKVQPFLKSSVLTKIESLRTLKSHIYVYEVYN